jgi:hypothetical protein
VYWALGGMGNSGRHFLEIFDTVLSSVIVLLLLDGVCENDLRKKLSPHCYAADLTYGFKSLRLLLKPIEIVI